MKNWIVLVIAGVLIIVTAVVLQLTGVPPQADAALAQQCRTRMADTSPELVARCDEQAFAAGMTATDAHAAAQAISAANNSEVGDHTLVMAMIGFGLALIIVGVMLRARQV